jgi:hypothetical protein
VEHANRRVHDGSGDEQDETEGDHVHRYENGARRRTGTVGSTGAGVDPRRRGERSLDGELRPALGAEDAALRSHHELAAARALERCPAQERSELLV